MHKEAYALYHFVNDITLYVCREKSNQAKDKI